MERPRTLCLVGSQSPIKSESLSPASESEPKSRSEDVGQFDEVSMYIREVDELLEFLKPFPRGMASQPIASDPHKPGLDHLENLIKLVEQLKDLKERNLQSQQKRQYQREVKLLRDSKRREKENAGKPLDDFMLDEPLPPPPDPPRKYRSSIPFRRSSRTKSTSYGESEKIFSSDNFLPHRMSLPQGKAKISKWTKVKEAFKWEKASQLETRQKHSKVDKKLDVLRQQEAPIAEETTTEEAVAHFGKRLQVPSEKSGDTPSPADSVLSGHISSCSSLGAPSSAYQLPSSGYSGDHSTCGDLAAPAPRQLCQDDSLSISLQELSYSSDDDLFNIPETVPRVSVAHDFTDFDTRRSKSLDGDTVLDLNQHMIQHLSKESLPDAKSQKFKTPWGKVKDIIHTRKGSIKKKIRKRDDAKDADLDELSPSYDRPFINSETHSFAEGTHSFMKPKIEVTIEHAPQFTAITPIRTDCSPRPLTPVLTLTLPSTEELQNLAKAEPEDKKPVEDVRVSDLSDDKSKVGAVPRMPRGSRWGKVKRAFLTTTSFEEGGPSSAPSSPLHLGSFFSDIESDDLSSGEWTEEKHYHELSGDMNAEQLLTTAMLKSEVQRNYDELQRNMFKELEGYIDVPRDLKLEEKSKPDQTDLLVKKPRESLTIPLPAVEDLSPEFKKKLDEWKKIKKSPLMPPTKEETQGHFISRIGEWPKWRTSVSGSSKPDHQQMKQEHHLQEEFCRKLEEWQMLKSGKRSRSHSDRGKDDGEAQSSSPSLSRKNSKRANKKAPGSGKSSGAESLSGSLKEKDGRAGRKSQKEKDLMWLEKELHKIEREKLRLEREKEKFLEREARLEQMKRTMGTTSPTQEVLIQTATGFFRFEGISQKFTKKLYEWEKARGIAPEASTFALLESAAVSPREERGVLQRSKSVGSVIDTSSAVSQSIAHHPSSLSLNDVDDVLEQANLLDASRASSEPAMDHTEKDDDEEPEAIIVDVEDVVIETAALLLEQPCVFSEVPVYSYAPAEVTQLIDSSGSDGERDAALQVSQVKAVSQPYLQQYSFENCQGAAIIDHLCEGNSESRNLLHEKNMEKVVESASGVALMTFRENSPKFVEEDNETQFSPVSNSIENGINLGDDEENRERSIREPRSDVFELSTQLLTLSHKLEKALGERNLIGEENSGKKTLMRMGNRKQWYSADEGSFTNTDLALRNSEATEVKGLPSLITKKVMELKSELNDMRSLKDVESPLSQHTQDVADVSYTVQIPKDRSATPSPSHGDASNKKKRPSLRIIPNEYSTPGENLSPVIVTISSPTWAPKGVASPREESIEQPIIVNESAEAVDNKSLKIKETSIPAEKKSPEVLKRKIKEKILELQRMSVDPSPWNQRSPGNTRKTFARNSDDESPDLVEEKSIVVVDKHRKLSKGKKPLKARRITDTTIMYGESKGGEPQRKENIDDEDDDDDVFNSEPVQAKDEASLLDSTPSYVFVPTSRKIISPVQRDTSSYVISYVIDDVDGNGRDQADSCGSVALPSTAAEARIESNEIPAQRKISEAEKEDQRKPNDIGIPPLPTSPSCSRKLLAKDAAPSIRMMIAKYNQKLSDQDGDSVSGNASPVGWKSPVLEKRIKEQIDKLQQSGVEALRHGGKFGRGEVRKSASAGFIRNADNTEPSHNEWGNRGHEDIDIHLRGVLKSSSTGTMKTNNVHTPSGVFLKSRPEAQKESAKCDSKTFLGLRALRIKQAKAEFLSRDSGGQNWSGISTAPASSSRAFQSSPIFQRTYSATEECRTSNRLSHVSVGSESSFDEPSISDETPNYIIKSASVGMIHATSELFPRWCPQGSSEPICVQKIIGQQQREEFNPVVKSGSRFAISNIRSRFRRVKMRKGKDKESAVSALCRQSLLVDVCRPENSSNPSTTSKSCPSSPVLERSKLKADDVRKWVRYPATLFKN